MRLILFTLTTLFLFQGCGLKRHVPFLKNLTLATKAQKETAIKECVTCTEDTSEFDDEFEEEEILLDPLGEYNTLMTSFNDQAITHFIDPLTHAYLYIFPEFFRLGLSNAFYNIKYPIRLSNNLLQGKFQNASDETKRFVVNSTLGLAGLIDVATDSIHIPKHNEDFGQTLGYYGVGAGFHVVLPFVGPSNLRDIVGLLGDGLVSPTVYVSNLRKYKIPQNYGQYAGLYAVDAINTNSHQIDAYKTLKQDALELYPFLRDVYEQKRNADILN